MPIDVSALSTNQIQNLVDNHRAKGATRSPLFEVALTELVRRRGNGLDFHKSFAAIERAARERRFLSYRELADNSGAEWSKVRYKIGPHLGELVEYCAIKDWPLLSAIVVNKRHVETGDMDDATLAGFVRAARSLGYDVVDEVNFLRQQQQAVFVWGQKRVDQTAV